MSDRQATALVVLHPGAVPGVAAERAGEVPPDRAAAARTVAWFADRGFETGPFVGISFAVSGSEELFRTALGARVPEQAGGPDGRPAVDREYPLHALDDDVRPLVAAIVVSAPPDFGPGNP